MKLLLLRDTFIDTATLGELFVDGAFECYTLEDTDRQIETRGVKINGQTAIPRGTYQVVIDFSNRFQRSLPRLLKVPYFEGIRIHPGNASVDTAGCILVGKSWLADRVGQSHLAFERLYEKLKVAVDRGEAISIEIAGRAQEGVPNKRGTGPFSC